MNLVTQFTDGLSFGKAVGGAIAISSMYVIGIHIFGKKGLNRDDPRVIRSRMLGATVGSAGAVYLFRHLLTQKPTTDDLLELLGIRRAGMLPALINSVGLTGTLFAGPILQYILQSTSNCSIEALLSEPYGKLMAFRAYIMAPLSEELVFRACLVPILHNTFQGDSSRICTLVPLFFGVAHAHHLFEKIFILRQDFKLSLLQTVIQMTYTTVFGALSTFLYLKTAQLPAVVAIHAMCNVIGLPDFHGIYTERSRPKKILLELTYLAGVAGFFYGCSLIKPTHYSNTVFY